MKHPITYEYAIELIVPEEQLFSYTTLLQSGILLQCPSDWTIGVFLGNLPGFNMDYITNRIQTIFLDGNAIDDMQAVFGTTAPVLALSAAMPGLAGAIFRKNSLHAALRKEAEVKDENIRTDQSLTVCLKLFNAIAHEKGAGVLQQGGIFPGHRLSDFFLQRSSLQQNISHCRLEGTAIDTEALWDTIEPQRKYHVTIHP